MTARYYLDTNIFGKLIKDKNYFDVFSIETNRNNEFPNLLPIYFTPFSIIEYLGIKIQNPVIKCSQNLRKNTIETEIERILYESYQYYMSLHAITKQNILQVAEKTASFIEKNNLYFGAFCNYILTHKSFEKELALHLAVNYIYNYRFPSSLRSYISATLSYDLFRNYMLPYSISKFRLIENVWDTQWTRFNKESEGKFLSFDKALRLKANRDNVDCDIIHQVVMGFESNRKTHPVYVLTADLPKIIIPRISVYKALVRIAQHQIYQTNAIDKKYLITNSEGIIVFIDQEGKVIKKINVSEIPAFGKPP
ncbi:hypothetical protein [Leptospira interrogans]|uniref:Uncharacterized protein n=1 Tax=Leptospira interrogans str. UI 12758 TaxID=1049938 RepID=A0A0E2D3N6_LEPIR|nr:hypothetical protein [Leptospira interrogans]EKR54597.1 hypothetical protein LEP1GSC105_0088 [Leptospira interrogans str. UI 12758]